MLETYLKKILTARVYDVAHESALDYASLLSAKIGNDIWLKREDLQPVFSFKLRGAFNKISRLSAQDAAKGVIAASAGNHAQGVALAANQLAVKALIVMPKTAPTIKVKAVQSLGGKTLLRGDTYDDAYEYAKILSEEKGMVFIHPYDDPDVIAGQGTVAMEILHQRRTPIDAIFVPVGGGGLIAGIAAYVKALRPEIKVIGVEPQDAACLHAALEKNRRVTLKQVGIFADGVAVRQIGKEPFKIARKTVDEVILVSTDEICAATKDIFDDTRAMVEPAGALAVAGIKKYVAERKINNQSLIAINSGANINFDRLRHVAERAEIGERTEALLAVTIPEKPGSFLQFCKVLDRRGITEFNYRYSDMADAQVFAGIRLTDGDDERKALLKQLAEDGYAVVDLTDNEMAKLHIRYMVGGRAPTSLDNEVIYRFQFPERPGAFQKFLSSMGKHWNISLFHYRNHGAAYGRVLVGMQLPAKEHKQFRKYMDHLGYAYWEETDNPAYALFLGDDCKL